MLGSLQKLPMNLQYQHHIMCQMQQKAWLFLPQPQQFKWKIMNGFEHETLYQLCALLSSL